MSVPHLTNEREKNKHAHTVRNHRCSRRTRRDRRLAPACRGQIVIPSVWGTQCRLRLEGPSLLRFPLLSRGGIGAFLSRAKYASPLELQDEIGTEPSELSAPQTVTLRVRGGHGATELCACAVTLNETQQCTCSTHVATFTYLFLFSEKQELCCHHVGLHSEYITGITAFGARPIHCQVCFSRYIRATLTHPQ